MLDITCSCRKTAPDEMHRAESAPSLQLLITKIDHVHILIKGLRFLQIFAADKNPHPINITVPEKICAYSNPPSFFWISCPAMGGPVRTAKETMVNTMPMRVPCMRKLGVREDRVAGKSDCMAAPTMP